MRKRLRRPLAPGACAAALVVTAALASCGEERPEPPTPEEDAAARARLIGSEWRLTAIEPGEGESLEPTQEASEIPLVAFASDPPASDGTDADDARGSARDPDLRRLEGHGGCNSFSGTYRLAAEGELAVRGLFATEVACMPPEVMEVESAFLSFLSDAETYRFDGEDLVISGPLGALRLSPAR